MREKGAWNCHNLLMYIAIKMAAAHNMSIKLFSLFNECLRRLWVKRNYHYLFFIKTMVVASCEGIGRKGGLTNEGVCRRHVISNEAWLNYFDLFVELFLLLSVAKQWYL